MSKHHIEYTNHEGKIFHRINPEDVDLNAMQDVQKRTSVYAYQVKDEPVEIQTISSEILETTNIAFPGDWVIYNLGQLDTSNPEEFASRIKECDQKIIRAEFFHKLYGDEDSSDNSTFDEYSNRDPENSTYAALYHYIGKPIKACSVPFNFFITAPWGKDQYIEKGGYLVYNTNTSSKEFLDVYGTSGVKENDRRKGQMASTYSLVQDGKMQNGLMKDEFQNVLKFDRSPLPGIQFNLEDLGRAYEIAGRGELFEKFV